MDDDILKTGDNTKEKIIKTTLDLMAKEGEQAITVRRIAKLAGVNPGLIHYYFGAKDHLVGAAFNFFMGKMAPVLTLFAEPGEITREKVEFFFEKYMENILEYPGVIKTFIGKILFGGGSAANLPEPVKTLLQKLLPKIGEFLHEPDPETATMKVMQTMFPIVFSVLLADAVMGIGNIDLHDKQVRKKFLKLLLEDNLFSKI